MVIMVMEFADKEDDIYEAVNGSGEGGAYIVESWKADGVLQSEME